MFEKLKNICRLCGKKDEQIKNIVNTECPSPDLCKTIEKHFYVKIECNNQICNECENFLFKLIEFNEIVQRTQLEFLCSNVETENEEHYQSEDENLSQEECDTPQEENTNSHKPQNSILPKVKKRKSKLYRFSNSEREIKRFLCDLCGKAYKSSSDLGRHKDFHRDDNDTPFACNICDKKFKSKLVKALHEKRHNANGYSCSICGSKLKTTNTLRNHMLMHSDELPFKCDHCDKRFRRKKGLTVHLVSHSGAQPFTCAFCEKPFSLRSNLKVHQRKMHPDELVNYEREGKMTIITDVIKKKFACGHREARNEQSVTSPENDP